MARNPKACVRQEKVPRCRKDRMERDTGRKSFPMCSRLLAAVFSAVLLLGSSGCSTHTAETQAETEAIDYTVVDVRKLPQELADLIEENKQEEMRLTYTDGGSLYLVRGYGEQKTGGYSIEVTGCVSDGQTIWFDTRLIGPSGQEKLPQEPSYPYLVAKIETREEEILIR